MRAMLLGVACSVRVCVQGHRRGPNVELSPTWEDFRVGNAVFRFPCLLCEAMTDIAVGRELVWDYGEAYWAQLKNLEMLSPKGSADSGVPSPLDAVSRTNETIAETVAET